MIAIVVSQSHATTRSARARSSARVRVPQPAVGMPRVPQSTCLHAAWRVRRARSRRVRVPQSTRRRKDPSFAGCQSLRRRCFHSLTIDSRSPTTGTSSSPLDGETRIATRPASAMIGAAREANYLLRRCIDECPTRAHAKCVLRRDPRSTMSVTAFGSPRVPAEQVARTKG
jgi:hypothetical protein